MTVLQNIGLLTENHCWRAMERTLTETRPNVKIRQLAFNDLGRAHFINNLDLLILPGIAGEKSNYETLYTARIRHTLSALSLIHI